MANASNSNDLFFTIDGDYLIGPGGDLLDTDAAILKDRTAAIKQSITHRILAEQNGWSLHPQLCAGLEQFLGRQINQGLLDLIQSQVHYVLTHDGLFAPNNLIVRVINLGQGTEAVALTIYLRGFSDKPVFMLAFDIQNGQISQVI